MFDMVELPNQVHERVLENHSANGNALQAFDFVNR